MAFGLGGMVVVCFDERRVLRGEPCGRKADEYLEVQLY